MIFNLNELKNKPVETISPHMAKAEKFISLHTEKIDNLKNLVKPFPGPGEAFFLWTMQSFNTFTFIPYLIGKFGKIETLMFTTYSINARIVNSLVKWFDKGLIESVEIIISDSFKHRMPKVDDLLNMLAHQRPHMVVKYAWNHSKVTLIEADSHKFIIEGSGNFSENAQHEQYLFMNSPEVYEFRKKCIKHACNFI